MDGQIEAGFLNTAPVSEGLEKANIINLLFRLHSGVYSGGRYMHMNVIIILL